MNTQLVVIGCLFTLFFLVAGIVCCIVIFLGAKGIQQRAQLKRRVLVIDAEADGFDEKPDPQVYM